MARKTQNLLVVVLGNSNSGKSFTWNKLFKRRVKTGKKSRKLYLTNDEYVEVFLVSGSPEEREIDVRKIITPRNKPPIVLCSMQYQKEAVKKIKWFAKNRYFLFIHWLNPGHGDSGTVEDNLNFTEEILAYESLLGIRDGKISAKNRVQEMRDFIYGWACSRKLLRTP
jgi:hypothetical protein